MKYFRSNLPHRDQYHGVLTRRCTKRNMSSTQPFPRNRRVNGVTHALICSLSPVSRGVGWGNLSTLMKYFRSNLPHRDQYHGVLTRRCTKRNGSEKPPGKWCNPCPHMQPQPGFKRGRVAEADVQCADPLLCLYRTGLMDDWE
jgi:hypothetical protein